VTVSWVAPGAQGIVISSYVIVFRTSQNTFVQDSTYCIGTNPTIVANTLCTIPLASLTAEPFNLVLGDSVNV
jgi:hypothetical protein